MDKIEKRLLKYNIEYKLQSLNFGKKRYLIDRKFISIFDRVKNIHIDYLNWHSGKCAIMMLEDKKELDSHGKNITTLTDLFFKSDYKKDSHKAQQIVLKYAEDNNMMMAYNHIYN